MRPGQVPKAGESTQRLIAQRVQESIAVKQRLLADAELSGRIVEVAAAMSAALRNEGKIIFFGNGGSAADAQHLAAELTGRYLRERRALPALSLTTNTSALTAIGNDYSYEMVFARLLEAFGQRGDVAFGISTSGNSPSVVRAMEVAGHKGLVTVAMTGAGGGRLNAIAQHCLCIPSQETPRIQEAHILVGHILCEIVEEALLKERV